MQPFSDLKNEITKIAQDRHLESNGKCGVYLISISQTTGETIKRVTDVTNQLVKENVITIRPGIHGNMIFKND